MVFQHILHFQGIWVISCTPTPLPHMLEVVLAIVAVQPGDAHKRVATPQEHLGGARGGSELDRAWAVVQYSEAD